MAHDHQVAILWSFMVVTSRDDITVLYGTGHPIYECPTPIVTMVLDHNFYHNCNSDTYVADDNTFTIEYGRIYIKVLLRDTVNSDKMSIAHHIFAEVSYVFGRGLSYSLDKVFDHMGGMD